MSLLEDKSVVLAEAIRADDVGALQALLASGISPNLRDSRGFPALVLAAELNRYGCVRALLDAGADPKGAVSMRAKTLRGFTVLHWGLDENVARALLEAGADANAVSESHLTPLDLSVAAADAEYTRLLLAHGAKVSDEFKDPKYWARLSEKFEPVRRVIFAHLTASRVVEAMTGDARGSQPARPRGVGVAPL